MAKEMERPLCLVVGVQMARQGHAVLDGDSGGQSVKMSLALSDFRGSSRG